MTDCDFQIIRMRKILTLSLKQLRSEFQILFLKSILKLMVLHQPIVFIWKELQKDRLRNEALVFT